MAADVRVEDEIVYVLGRYVSEGQPVAPKDKLLRVMTADGMSKDIEAHCFGVIANIVGELLDDPLLNGGMMFRSQHIFRRDKILCSIASHSIGTNMRDGRLHPRRAPALRARRLMGLIP